jgi:hypothetical protein
MRCSWQSRRYFEMVLAEIAAKAGVPDKKSGTRFADARD